MKCHEFMDAAETFTPSQLSMMRAEDCAISLHARECASCGRWLESQTLLGNAMQALRSSTAELAASPNVEQAVMRAFRDAELTSHSAVEPERAAPAAWKLSRIFEYGAYAAVAAALIMAVFLGSRLLHDRQAQQHPSQAHGKTASQPTSTTTTSAGSSVTPQVETSAVVTKEAKGRASAVRVQSSSPVSARADATASDTDDYVALMLCDPLICSGDEQVVRMELPAAVASNEGGGRQPVLADVVIGEDGLVRAMRIVR
jgi:hypothetical protein